MTKLREKETGDIINGVLVRLGEYGDGTLGTSIAEINEKYEDYEEPKEYWYIDFNGEVKCFQYYDYVWQKEMQSIGNYFETEEEAKKAVEKQKALERLRKNGFRFDGFRQDYTRWSSGHDAFRDGKRYIHFNKADDDDWLRENWKDLKLVFKEDE